MTSVWTCPACGTRNAVEQTECASCGRWASVFDLERTVETSERAEERAELAPVEAGPYEPEPVQLETYAPEPMLPSGAAGRPTAAEAVRTVFDTLRERGGGVEGEEQAPARRPSLVKWLVVALFFLWVVVPVVLDALR